MNVIIIEDEELAAERLELMLKRIDPTVVVVAQCDSVKTAVQFFKNNPAPDIAFVDIQLADGLSFEIFEQTRITCPIVFTTAYDEYALKAFKVNSIDYLLKPIDKEDLQRALEKLKALRTSTQATPTLDAATIQQVMTALVPTPQYRNRFMVKIGEHLSAIQVTDIAYFFGENKITWVKLKSGKKYILDYTLEQLAADMLNPTHFFRLNRQFITTIESIKDVITYSNSRLKIVLHDPPNKEDILISREKVEAFKNWLGQ
jgi:DNA-binding LytR/AlgR family response regulator